METGFPIGTCAKPKNPQRIAIRPKRDALWKRAVLLSLRLCTRIPNFSVCSSPADYDDKHPTEKIERLCEEVGRIAAEARGLLFGRQGMNLEIQQVLSELLTEKLTDSTPTPRDTAPRSRSA